jgi:hypothetical protein
VTERQYQAKVTKKIRNLFPGCMLIKNDPQYQQGIPDWTLLYGDKWGMIEIKASKNAPFQPNQEYYLEVLDDMSFAMVIYPEIEEDMLNALQEAFGV